MFESFSIRKIVIFGISGIVLFVAGIFVSPMIEQRYPALHPAFLVKRLKFITMKTDFTTPEKALDTYIRAIKADNTALAISAFTKATRDDVSSKIKLTDPIPAAMHAAALKIEQGMYKTASESGDEAFLQPKDGATELTKIYMTREDNLWRIDYIKANQHAQEAQAQAEAAAQAIKVQLNPKTK